ncbi:FCD domain protein [compost metagenome]
MRQISALYSVIEPHMRLWLQHADKPRSARDEHASIVAALRSGDPDKAAAVVCEHIEGTIPRLIQFLEAHQ